MDSDRSTIVIGGGLIGCASAYYLSSHGWKVTIVERRTIGSGASHGNCGYICPSHTMPLSGPGVIARTLPSLLKSDAPLAIPPRFDPELWRWLLAFRRECTDDRMMQAAAARNALLASSMNLYHELRAAESIDCEWKDAGLLLVYKSQKDFEDYKKTAETLKSEFSIEAVAYPGDQVKELEPALKSGMAGGWHFPNDSHVRPDKLLAGLKQALQSRGVEILENREVLALKIVAGKAESIETQSGPIAADQFVLATGAEAPRFAKAIGSRLPIQPGKGYSLTMPLPAKAPKIPMIFEDHHVAVTPMESSFRVGSTMEFTGYDSTLNPRRLALLRKSAEEHLEAPLPVDFDEEWTGWRPMVFDGLPCIGRAKNARNVTVAAGNGMIGLASAPATGKLVAELVGNVKPHIDPTPYALERF